MSMNLRRILGK